VMVRYSHSLIVHRYRRDCQGHVVAIRLGHQLSITAICEALSARRNTAKVDGFGNRDANLIGLESRLMHDASA
jgi:hypothetical protein